MLTTSLMAFVCDASCNKRSGMTILLTNHTFHLTTITDSCGISSHATECAFCYRISTFRTTTGTGQSEIVSVIFSSSEIVFILVMNSYFITVCRYTWQYICQILSDF